MYDITLCAVSEEQFPAGDRCLRVRAGGERGGYEALCPRCRVWSSLPYQESLKTVYIVSCNACGHVKRIIEEIR